MWVYLLEAITLFLLLLAYFKVANHFNIVDKPNQRSSHTKPTILGGGIVFYFGLVLYFFFSKFSYPYFFIGITLVTLVSFIDDLKPIRYSIRMLAQFIAVGLILYEIGALQNLPVWVTIVSLVVAAGIVNAYNFMDGINGITGAYSAVALASLWLINKQVETFIDGRLILFLFVAVMVFNFFNFRRNARCFAGDVGSVSMAFILVFFIALLCYSTKSIIWVLLLGVYGVDSILTIVHRLMKRENIFEAHRFHLYQVVIHSGKKGHLEVASAYALVQVVLNVVVISLWDESLRVQLFVTICMLILLAFIYVAMKIHFLRKDENAA